MERRDFLKLLSLFSLSGSLPLLSACEKLQKTDPNAPLKIGYLPITDATSLLVAHAQGLFEKQGLKVEKPLMFRSWSQLVEAFFSGNVNLVHILSPMSLWARYGSQAPVKIVMWNHLAGSALTVSPDINHITDLSGKTVAIPFWYSIHNIVLQHLLRANGLRVTEKRPGAGEVKVTVMSPSDMVVALANQAISGFIVAEPFNAIAESKGVGKVLRFSGDVWRDHACCVTLMQEFDIQHRPEWVQKVVNALTEAQVYSLEHRAAIPAMIGRGSGYTPHDPAVLAKVLAPDQTQWQRYAQQGIIQHPEWQQNRIGFQPYPFDSYLGKLLEMLQETHLAGRNDFLTQLRPGQVIRELNAPQFARQAIEAGGWVDYFGLQAGWSRTEEIVV
ncbi:ABC transporter substrate-binding protein [Pasteurellaceae bacterium RH1A]|nr:ABC transporter substrate-binding protein [Pasteurellaceae bacterium RH1A]